MKFYILFFLFIFAVLYLRTAHTEPFQNNSNIVIALLCVCPTEIVINFAKKMAKSYKVYIVCDDIYCHTPEEPSMTFIKISDEEVLEAHYTKSNIAIGKIPSAWDKALYYFNVKNMSPSHVWFIEEDVFIPRVSILTDLDAKYPTADLIAKQNVRQEEDPDFEWWFDAEELTSQPLYRSLVCATRVSRKVLNEIANVVRNHGRLYFIEIMFNTIVHEKNMELAMPEELSAIIWRHDWRDEEIDPNHLYHPVKMLTTQKRYREMLAKVPNSGVEAFRGMR